MKTEVRRAVQLSAALFAVLISISAGTPAAAEAKSPKSAKARKAAVEEPEAGGTPSETTIKSFEAFCEEWMAKLAAREVDNVTHIKWERVSDGVSGTYVGYSHEHSCNVTDGTGHVAVGHVEYKEVKFRKQGPTEADAERSTPQPVEVYDATELFSYSKGKWLY